MPSLWKKQRGNKISRLVVDLQTPPKQNGSLIVENGLSTSLVDLYHKSRDKLKKPKGKKHKSKKLTTISEDEDEDYQPPSMSSANCLPRASYCDLDLTRCKNSHENVSHIDDNVNIIEYIGIHENLVVDLHEHNGESCNVEKYSCKIRKHVSFRNENHNSCNLENNADKIENGEVLDWNHMTLFSILMGVMVFVVTLYYIKWLLSLITLSFVVFLLLDFVGRLGVLTLKGSNNKVWTWSLKGALVVAIALYTKMLVLWIKIRDILMILLEYAGNSIFRFLKPCQDAKWKWKDVFPHAGDSKQGEKFDERRKKGGRGILKRAVLIRSKRSKVLNESNNTLISKRNSYQEAKNGVMMETKNEVPKCEFEQQFEEVGVMNLREIELGIKNGTIIDNNSCLLEDEKQTIPMHELLVLELQKEKGGIESREGDEECKIISQNGKFKKNKKFWKKLVSNKMSNNKGSYKHNLENCIINSIDNFVSEMEKEDLQEDGEHEISYKEGARSTSTTLLSNKRDRGEIENFEAINTCIIKMLQLQNMDNRSFRMVKTNMENFQYVSSLVIPLTGLIRGRMFAVFVTVIFYLVFKIVRKS